MAEFIFKDIVRKNNKSNEFLINSMAVSSEEIGNPVYPKALLKLKEKGIKTEEHFASRITINEYNGYDYIIVMDDSNLYYMKKMFNDTNKVYKLLDFTNDKRDVVDPWYTDNFEQAYQDIYKGTMALYKFLTKI